MHRPSLLGPHRPLTRSRNVRRHGTLPIAAMYSVPAANTHEQRALGRAVVGSGRHATARDRRTQASAVGRVISTRAAAEPGRVGEALRDERAERQDDDDGGLRDGGRLEALPVDEFQGGEDDCTPGTLSVTVKQKGEGMMKTHPAQTSEYRW
jgi:hypothetical protein